MPRTLRRWRRLKKPPGHLGSDPGGPPERYPHRTMVAGRGARGPDEAPGPAPRTISGRVRSTSSERSPQEGKGAALVLPRCDTQAMSLHLAEVAQAVAPG